MARKLKAAKIEASAKRANLRGEKARSAKWKVTLGILALLVVVLGAYELTQYMRTQDTKGGVEIVVGSQLMACINPQDVQGKTPLLDAMEEVSVRPTTMQKLTITGDRIDITISAGNTERYFVQAEGQQLHLYKDDRNLGNVQRIYLPID